MKYSMIERLTHFDDSYGSPDGYHFQNEHYDTLADIVKSKPNAHPSYWEHFICVGMCSDMQYMCMVINFRLIMLAGQCDESITPLGKCEYYGWDDTGGKWVELSDGKWRERYMNSAYYTGEQPA